MPNCYVAAEYFCPNMSGYVDNAFYAYTFYDDICQLTNSYYLNAIGNSNLGTQFSRAQMESGELTWLLNGSNRDNEPAWYQNLGGDADKMPVLDSSHKIVYKTIADGKISYVNAVSKVLESSDIRKVEYVGEQPVYDGKTVEYPVVVTIPKRTLIRQATDAALTVQPTTNEALSGSAVTGQVADLGATYEQNSDVNEVVTVAAVAVLNSTDAGTYETYTLKEIEMSWDYLYDVAEAGVKVDVTEAESAVKAAVGLVVAPKSITGAAVTLGTDLIYNGEMQTQTVSQVSVDGLVVPREDYEVTGNVNKDAGKYQLTITAKEDSNFTRSVTVDYEIAKAQINRVDISGITQPKQGETLDITADCSIAGVKIIDVIWYKGNDKVTETVADYNTAYTVRITCAADDNHSWIRELDTMPVTVDGKAASYLGWDAEANNGTGAVVMGYTFEKTESAPEPSGSTTPEPTGTPDPTISPNPSEDVRKGDVDDNGKVELLDAQMVLKMALKIVDNPTEQQRATAEVNGDSKVDLVDAQLILKFALKIINKFD